MAASALWTIAAGILFLKALSEALVSLRADIFKLIEARKSHSEGTIAESPSDMVI